MFASSKTFNDFLRIKIYYSLVFHGVGLDSLLRASRIVTKPKLKTGFERRGSKEGSRNVHMAHVNIPQNGKRYKVEPSNAKKRKKNKSKKKNK